MNKAYLIFPLVGLLIFGGFYMSFNKNYEANIAAMKAKAEDAKKEKLRQEAVNRDLAIKAAIQAQETRRKERDARDAAEEAKRVARQTAEDLRVHNYDERNKFRDQVGRLKKDLEEVKAAAAKIADEKKRYIDEDAAQKVYVKQAEANVKYYYDLLDKIAAAEKAAAEAAAAAAAAAKKG